MQAKQERSGGSTFRFSPDRREKAAAPLRGTAAAEWIKPVQNHVRALECGIGELKKKKHLTNNLLYATHDVLMEHKRKHEMIVPFGRIKRL